MPNPRKTIVVVALVTLIFGFSGGIWFDRTQPPLFSKFIQSFFKKDFQKPEEVDFSLFWEVWNALNKKFVDKDKIDKDKMLYGAISGMVNSVGDPYTVFLEPVTNQKFQDEIKGEFGGVGMEIGKRNDVLTVIAPIKGTPADHAGIKAGDRILKIDGKSTIDMTVESAVNLIRGKPGTKVILMLSPASNGTTRTVEVVREVIKIPVIELKYFNNGSVAYIAVYSFNQNVAVEFEKAAKQVLASGAKRLVIDLRNNPGGLLERSVDLAGWFLDPKSLVTTETFGDGTKNEFRTRGAGNLKHLPTVVLINGGSASASEILAGALHDNRAIKLVGEKSFGKGSVQQLEEFSDGSSLKVTVAKWLTPSGISISDKGILADVEVKIGEEMIKAGNLEMGTPGKDPQLDKALEIVNGL